MYQFNNMVKPLGSLVIVKTEELPETVSGILIPRSQDDKDKKDTGVVVSVGPDVTEVMVGDKILFKKWGAEVVEVEKEMMNFVEESDILAILVDEI